MGADEALHLLDPAFEGSDAFATAKILAAAAKNRPFDILFFGKMGVGMDQSEVPSMIAELLNLPQISAIAKLEVGDGKVTAHREIEDRQFGVVTVQPGFDQGGSGLEASRK